MSEISGRVPDLISQDKASGLEKTRFERGDADKLEAIHPLALKLGKANEVANLFATDPSAKQFLHEQGVGKELVIDRVTVKKISWGKEWYESKDLPPAQRDTPQPFDAPRVVYKVSLQSDGKRENVYLKVFLGHSETQENIARFLESESKQGNKAIPSSAVTKVDDAVVLIQKEAPGRQLRDKFKDLKNSGDAITAEQHLEKIAKWLADFHQSNSGLDTLTPSDIQAESDDFSRYAKSVQSLFPSHSPAFEAYGLLEKFMPNVKKVANRRTGTDYPTHNDFRPGHIYITDDPEDIAVIDWDRAVKGSPAKDVALLMNEIGHMGVGHIEGVDLREYFLEKYKENSTLDIGPSLDVYRIHAKLQNDRKLKTPEVDDIAEQARVTKVTNRTLTFVNERIGSLRDNLRDDLDEETLEKMHQFQNLLNRQNETNN
jgi:thiamine kinase-like enzyme